MSKLQGLLSDFIKTVLDKAEKNAKSSSDWQQPNLSDLKENIPKVIYCDQSLKLHLRELRRELTTESWCVTNFRNGIRPLISLILTFVFAWLIYKSIEATQDYQYDKMKEILTIFLAVYGPILGFWFGEHTALKGRQEESDRRDALEQEFLRRHYDEHDGGTSTKNDNSGRTKKGSTRKKK